MPRGAPHRPLYQPLADLAQNRKQSLFYTHRHLPALPLLFLSGFVKEYVENDFT